MRSTPAQKPQVDQKDLNKKSTQSREKTNRRGDLRGHKVGHETDEDKSNLAREVQRLTVQRMLEMGRTVAARALSAATRRGAAAVNSPATEVSESIASTSAVISTEQSHSNAEIGENIGSKNVLTVVEGGILEKNSETVSNSSEAAVSVEPRTHAQIMNDFWAKMDAPIELTSVRSFDGEKELEHATLTLTQANTVAATTMLTDFQIINTAIVQMVRSEQELGITTPYLAHFRVSAQMAQKGEVERPESVTLSTQVS